MDDTSGPPAADVAYENTADEAWARKARALYQRRQLQVQAFDTGGVVSAQVWGPCPRCGHGLNIQKTLSAPLVENRGPWAALTRRSSPAAAGIPDHVEVGCGCGHPHPGAPEQATGCGVSFRLPTTPPDTPRTS